MSSMEVYEASDYFIVHDGDHSLWCNRSNGMIEAKPGYELCNARNPVCLGVIHGVIGKVQILPDSEWRLLLIKHHEHVGKTLHDADVYRIGKVAFLPLSMRNLPPEFELNKCEKHHFGISKPKQITQQGKQMLQSTWNSLQKVKDTVQSKKNSKDPQKEHEKLEKRIIEELAKMYNISDFYYYSPEGDITNSIQRQSEPSYNRSDPLWKRADERFFWNRSLLSDLINSNSSLADHWIQPIIQGYFDIRQCAMTESDGYHSSTFHKNEVFEFTVSLLSRRNRHRAGTRYKRRGVDEEGDCANFVETEQMHTVSYVQVRGSIPVYWSQPGHKYRPPPILDRGEKETEEAFTRHFDKQISVYKHITCMSLVDRLGREKTMADAFLHHVVLYNSPNIAYVAFDFHEYCRGMQFDNVVMLTDACRDIIKSHKYCWVDGEGMICEQNGVFRVNCIDCLDRTNVVQTAVARIIIDQQVRKLGLLTPDEELPDSIRQVFNQLWANNGDAISRQYAGTAAMKGDYTRTGERKFSGLMKDGMKSANRYLIHRFKDMYRQAAINIQLGQPLEPDILILLTKGQQAVENQEDENEYIREKASDVVSVIEEGRNLLIMEPEQCLGGWAVISLDEQQDSSVQDNEMDTILLLTNSYYYIVTYDDELDCLTHYLKIPITDVYAIDIGPEASSVFKSRFLCVRFWYKYYGEAGYFHTLRVPNVRAFNNTIIEIKNPEDEKEILRAIADTFKVASELAGGIVNIRETKIEQKRFRAVPKRSIQTTSIEANIWARPQKIASMASHVVNKAASNMRKVTSQLKKINLSPRHTSQDSSGRDLTEGQDNPALDGDSSSMSEFDNFDDNHFGLEVPEGQQNGDASPHTHPKEEDTQKTPPPRPTAPPKAAPRIIKTRTLSVGSLPDLSVVGEDEMRPEDHMLGVTPTQLTHSSPQIYLDDSEVEITTNITEHVEIYPNITQHADKSLSTQVHHCTAPDLLTLDTNGEREDTTPHSPSQLHTPSMRVSFSDDAALKTYSIQLPDASAAGQRPSALSKIKSGLSQVSHLIVNPNSSPHSRRRKQVLEAQLLDNTIKSKLRFKNCQTKIVLL